jgi:hypothetical protein
MNVVEAFSGPDASVWVPTDRSRWLEPKCYVRCSTRNKLKVINVSMKSQIRHFFKLANEKVQREKDIRNEG